MSTIGGGVALTRRARSSAPVPPSLSVTATRTVNVPATGYVWLAVIAKSWRSVEPALDVPSPQSTVYAHGASPAPPGSLKLALKLYVPPGGSHPSAPAFTTGGRFAIVAVVVAGWLATLLVSVTMSVTV